MPGPELPVPTKHSGYINADGELVLPEGARCPPPFPSNQASEPQGILTADTYISTIGW